MSLQFVYYFRNFCNSYNEDKIPTYIFGGIDYEETIDTKES